MTDGEEPEDLVELNRRRWNELVPHHVASSFYDVEGFRSGRDSLLPVEIAEVGEVRGKRLLHLQCHFGLDTLSWARRGAEVTGLDFSSAAIATARSLAAELGLAARFVEGEVARAPELLPGERFDIVFTSYGVLGWNPDLAPWALAIARLLAPDGFLYVLDTHPLALVFDEQRRLRYRYFGGGVADVEEVEGSYAAPQARLGNKREAFWVHPLSTVVEALLGAGLQLESLREFPFHVCALGPDERRREDGYWEHPATSGMLPRLFSLRARPRRADAT